MGRKNVNAQSRAMISRLDTCLFVMLASYLKNFFAALTPTSMQRKKEHNSRASHWVCSVLLEEDLTPNKNEIPHWKLGSSKSSL